MTAILVIGVVIALAMAALLAKAKGGESKKAKKWEKADIMKQLLALSENEMGPSPVVPSRRPPTGPSAQIAKTKFHRKPPEKVSQGVHASKQP